jgi:hypothetical protein
VPEIRGLLPALKLGTPALVDLGNPSESPDILAVLTGSFEQTGDVGRLLAHIVM